MWQKKRCSSAPDHQLPVMKAGVESKTPAPNNNTLHSFGPNDHNIHKRVDTVAKRVAPWIASPVCSHHASQTVVCAALSHLTHKQQQAIILELGQHQSYIFGQARIRPARIPEAKAPAACHQASPCLACVWVCHMRTNNMRTSLSPILTADSQVWAT